MKNVLLILSLVESTVSVITISAIALKKDEFYVQSNSSTKSIIIFVILYEFGCFLLSLYGIGIHSRRPDRSPGKKLFRIHSTGALILVGSSCTLVASGGWLLYQNQLATNFGRRPSPQVSGSQAGFFVAVIGVIGFILTMALTVTSIHLRSTQEQIVEKRKHHFDIEESGISMGISRGSSRSGSRRSSRSQLSFGGISNLSDVEEDEEQKIRNYHHRRGPRPSIDAGGFLMPLPCSRPQSRRSSLTTGATQKKRSPPQKSYSVADITEQKRGRPFISQRTDSKGSLFSNKTEDSICSAKRPIIRAYSPDNQQIILSSPHSPKTFGNAAASSSRSPQTKKNIMLSTNDHISIDSLSMAPRLSIIAEKAVEISDQEESV